MESGSEMDTFLEAVLNGVATLNGFSPSPSNGPLAPEPANSEPNISTEAVLDFEAYLNTLDWGDIKETLTTTVEGLLGDTSLVSNSQSPPPTSPAVLCDPEPAVMEPQPEPRPEPTKAQNGTESGQGPHEAAPQFNRPVTHQLYHQPRDSQQQVPAPEVMALPHYPVPPRMMNGNLVVPASMLCPVGVFNGQMMYQLLAEPSTYSSASVAPSNVTSRKRQHDSNNNNIPEKPYIKKPPNAFMLYRAEQRLKVMEELKITDSAAVNTEIGQRWRMLSEEEKAVYFEQAHAERRAHAAKYPDWSPYDNFGRKAKRKRTTYTAPAYNNSTAAPVAPVFSHVPSYQPAPNNYGPVTWHTPGYY